MDAFAGRRAALGTSHEKERVIAPILEQALGLSVVVPTRFNSDRFGTFTREKKRHGSQLDAARAKAYAAMALIGTDIGIASEGSFGSDPAFPLMPSNLELIVFIDRALGIEVRGEYRGGACVPKLTKVRSAEEAVRVARSWGFPGHGVIVRLSPHTRYGLYKEVRDEDALVAIVQRLLTVPFVRSVWLEADLRAHRNPTRMEAIAAAARDLAQRLATPCPRCSRPGFGTDAVVPGAPCATCASPTDQPRATRMACPTCGFSDEQAIPEASASPESCGYCNP